jgi:hypothetical protein
MDMLSPAVAIVLQLVTLHGIEGRPIMINPAHVTMLISAPPGEKNKHLVSGVNCLLHMSSGKFFTVVETCDQVAALLKAWRAAQ